MEMTELIDCFSRKNIVALTDKCVDRDKQKDIANRQAKLICVLLLFTIALSGIVWQFIVRPQFEHRLLALALLLLGIDQARMAIVDLTQIHRLKPTTSDREAPLLKWFETITWSTIALELIGFFLSWQWLGWGSSVVLLSQLWFNFLAGVQLVPDATPSIQTFGIKDRAVVLMADSFGLILCGLYGLTIQPFAMAIGLLSMVLLYGLIKYAPIAISDAFVK